MDIVQLCAIVAIVPWLALLILRPKVLTVLIIFLALFQLSWFTRYFGAPPILNRASLGISGLLGLRIFFDILREHYPFVKRGF